MNYIDDLCICGRTRLDHLDNPLIKLVCRKFKLDNLKYLEMKATGEI